MNATICFQLLTRRRILLVTDGAYMTDYQSCWFVNEGGHMLVKNQLVTEFIPFLPLSQEIVMKCIGDVMIQEIGRAHV